MKDTENNSKIVREIEEIANDISRLRKHSGITVTFSRQVLSEINEICCTRFNREPLKPLKPKPHWSQRQHKKNTKKTTAMFSYGLARWADAAAENLREEIDSDILHSLNTLGN